MFRYTETLGWGDSCVTGVGRVSSGNDRQQQSGYVIGCLVNR